MVLEGRRPVCGSKVGAHSQNVYISCRQEISAGPTGGSACSGSGHHRRPHRVHFNEQLNIEMELPPRSKFMRFPQFVRDDTKQNQSDQQVCGCVCWHARHGTSNTLALSSYPKLPTPPPSPPAKNSSTQDKQTNTTPPQCFHSLAAAKEGSEPPSSASQASTEEALPRQCRPAPTL